MTRFFGDIRGKRVAFLGLGVSHGDCVRLFLRHGAKVAVCDKREADDLPQAQNLEALGAQLRLGEGYLSKLQDFDIVFRTPGMPFHLPELVEYRRAGGILTSEMEVFFDLCPCPVLAVTGSDGKTTTTTLIAEMLNAQGYLVHLGGNIGRPLLPVIEEIRPSERAVVELSSFQLISMRASPTVSVVTNVEPNHLDLHKDMEEYVEAKRNIYLHQNAFSHTVLNLDNAVTASFAPQVRGLCSYFSLQKPVYNGAYLDSDGTLNRCAYGKVEPVMEKGHIRIPGMHNVANYLAAISAVQGLVQTDTIRKVAAEFGGVEHRIELVRELNGVRWYNDSIATSPTRSIAGLRSFNRKIIMIAGGYDKKIPYEPLAADIVERVSALILTGDTAPKIEAAVRAYPGYGEGIPAIFRAENLEEAVDIAHKTAKTGDIVSLCPASASFDHYPNFEARGRHFKQLVMELAE